MVQIRYFLSFFTILSLFFGGVFLELPFNTGSAYVFASESAVKDQGSARPILIRVGAYVNPPKIYKNDANQVVGLFPDILKDIAREEGWILDYVWGTWQECLDRVEQGKIDIMVDVAYSEARSRRFDFSDQTVLMNWGVVYTRSDSPIDTIMDLNHKTIAVMGKSIHSQGKNSIRDLTRRFEISCRYKEVEDYQAVFEDLKDQQVDAGVVNRLFGALHKSDYQVVDSPVVFNPRHLKFAFPKHSKRRIQLKSEVDAHLKKLKTDSSSVYYQIIKAYLSGAEKPWVITETRDETKTISMSDAEKAWVREHNAIKVGFDPEFVPFEYLSKAGEYEGIASEFLELIGKRIGIQFIPQMNFSWEESILKAKEKQIDVLPCMGITKEREAHFLFSKPYLSFSRVVVTRNNARVKSLDDLENLVVAVQEHSSHSGYLKESTRINPVHFPTFESAMKSVSMEDTDAVVGNLTVATHMIREQGLSNLKIAAFVSEKTFPLAFAIRKDWPELLGLIDRALASITPAERTRIQKNWFHVEINQSRDRLFKTMLTEPELKWIQNHPVIRTGIDSGYAPYSFLDSENRFNGLAVDILNRIQEMTGLEFHHLPDLTWPQIITGAQIQKVDLILTCVKTKSRESFLDFTDIYIPTPLVIMTRTDYDGISLGRDLPYKRVALVKGYSSTQKIMKEYPQVVPVFVDTPLEGLKTVANNQAEAYVGVLGINVFHARQNGLTNLKVAASYDDGKNGQRLAVRKDWPILRSILSKALQAIPLEEKTAIFQKWLPIESKGESMHFMSLLKDHEKQWLTAHPIVRVCSDPNYAPLEFKKDDGRYHGIAIDYLKLLEENLGIRFEIQDIENWSKGVEQVKAGKIDMISGIMETAPRKEHFSFTTPYLEIPIVIFTRNDTTYVGSLKELSRKKVLVVQGYATAEMISRDYPLVELVEASTIENALAMLENKEATACVASILTAGYYVGKRNFASLKVAGKTPYTARVSMAVRKDFDVLAGILQKFFHFLPETEKNTIYRKWISIKYEHQTSLATLFKTILPILLLLFILMYWVKRLKSEIRLRKKTEQQLFVAKQQADSANRAKSTFLANMSHEIRTPMNAILGYTQLLGRDTNLTTDQKSSLTTINKSGEHLLLLINDILELSKIEAGRFDLTAKVFDLYELLDTVFRMFKVRADEKGVFLKLHQSDDLIRIIKADEGKIKQILINLLSNALKFTAYGGITLRVMSASSDSTPNRGVLITFEVEDTGRGIAKEDLKRIFHSFEQVGDSSLHEGTGLGLTISQKFAALMDGDISVSSKKNKGSVFRFSCRAEKGSKADLEAVFYYRDVIKLADGQKKIKALIADDKPTNRHLLSKMLERAGFVTKEVNDGKQAVELWQAWYPDIILMDLVMPVMDGTTAIKEIRRQTTLPQPVIIAVTASILRDEKEGVLKQGANDFLSKPFLEGELFYLIEKHLGVDFVYAEESSMDENSVPETVDQVGVLPLKLKDELVSALKLGHTKRINTGIDQVSQYAPHLFKRFKDLAAGFEYQKILEIIGPDK